jgi:lycopene cyclase domain-containing protein
MNLYLWILVAIAAVPLALSFEPKVRYVRRWPAVFAAAGLVGSVYIGWDILKTEAGVWGFAERYAGSLRILGLPLPEVLFFLVVPFSCLFIYEAVRAYFTERRLAVPRWVWFMVAGLLAAAAVIFRSQLYTLTALLSVALFFVLAAVFQPCLLETKSFWLAMLLTYVPFLIFNGLLTAVPVVIYNDAENWGLRVYTIPLEDFFYSFSLLGFNIFVFRIFRRRFPRAGRSTGRRRRVTLPGKEEVNCIHLSPRTDELRPPFRQVPQTRPHAAASEDPRHLQSRRGGVDGRLPGSGAG